MSKPADRSFFSPDFSDFFILSCSKQVDADTSLIGRYLFDVEPNDTISQAIEVSTQNQIVGFIDYWHTFDSATLAQIAVHPSYQKQHLADMMMEEMISDCYAKRVEYITLEVRVNNSKAINLYKKHKFENILVKPHYYTNGDDAYYMIRKVEM